MQRSFFYIIVLAGFFSLFSCKNSHDNHIKREMDHDIRVYHQAIKFGDVGTAIHAMQSLLAWDSTHTSYYDTLAVLYFHSQNYPQAIQAAQVILDKDSNNEKLLKIVAQGYRFLGRYDLSVPYFIRLATLSPSPLLDYELASSYLFLKDYNQVNVYAQKIIANKNSDSTMVNITFNEGRDQQDVPVKAAVQNLLGTMFMNEHQKTNAVAAYKQAIVIYPYFALAKQNLAFIEKGK